MRWFKDRKKTILADVDKRCTEWWDSVNSILKHISIRIEENAAVDKHIENKIDGVAGRVLAIENKFQSELSEEKNSREIQFMAIQNRLDSLDKTVASMTLEQLENFIKNKYILFENTVDDKLVGLYRSVDEKIAKGNGHVKATAGLLKRIAFLEGVKDASEHRRSTKDIMDKVDFYKAKISALDRSDNNYGRYEDALNILQWVLGDKNE